MLNVDKMLRRLLGEDVELVTVADPKLWRVRIDPGQFEQVLVNLAVNARDAMPEGGRLLIETGNIELDADFARQHATVQPGPHVLLAVTDTGFGMDPEVLAHIFEPFFTTKEVGKGTGLGLATCYGIVKQNRGSIWVYSERGRGTTFKIYLPRADAAVESREVPEPRQADALRGSETVLLVEDESVVRALAADALRRHGFQVLTASTGTEALELAGQTLRPFDVLVTDVVMPQMGGQQLAEHLLAQTPALKVLFISGYTDSVLTRDGRAEAGNDAAAEAVHARTARAARPRSHRSGAALRVKTSRCCRGSASLTSVESKTFGLELGLRVRHGHLVLFANRHRRIFLPVFQQHEAAGRPKRPAQMPQHDLRMLELVIDVHHQLEIEAAVGQLRIVGFAQHGDDVAETFLLRTRVDEGEHLGLDVDGIHAA